MAAAHESRSDESSYGSSDVDVTTQEEMRDYLKELLKKRKLGLVHAVFSRFHKQNLLGAMLRYKYNDDEYYHHCGEDNSYNYYGNYSYEYIGLKRVLNEPFTLLSSIKELEHLVKLVSTKELENYLKCSDEKLADDIPLSFLC